MAAKLYQDQVLNHMWEFPDDATPEEMDGFVAKHHARAGEHLAKQGWGRELFQAAQPLVQQAVGGGATQGSALAPYGANDVFGLGTQQVTQLQQNFQQDQVHQQRSAADERAMLMQQEEQEKDRSLRLKVLQQKEKNDKIEADLNSRRVDIAQQQVDQDETQMNRGDLITGPDGGMYQRTYDQAGNPVVGSTPVLPAPAQTVSMGGYLWEKSGDGWRKVAGDGPQSSSGGGGGGTTEVHQWTPAELNAMAKYLKDTGDFNDEYITAVLGVAATMGQSPDQVASQLGLISQGNLTAQGQPPASAGTNPTAPAPTMVLPDISTRKQGEAGRFSNKGQVVEIDESGNMYEVVNGVGAIEIRSLNTPPQQKTPRQKPSQKPALKPVGNIPNVPFSPGGYMPPSR